jgi:circadian clock protein KaiB
MAADDYCLRLFVAGDEPNSRLAAHNLHALCAEHLPGRHRIEVIDVLEDFDAALAARIMVAPAVMMVAPRAVTLYGTLADKAKVEEALGLNGAGLGR